MSFASWNANIDPAAVLERAISGMRAHFEKNANNDIMAIDRDEAEGHITAVEAALRRAAVVARSASTEKTIETQVRPRLAGWLGDPDIRRISPAALSGIADAVDDARWDHLFEAYFTDIKFGTGGIRGRAVMSVAELRNMAVHGVGSTFLRGPNLFSDLTVLRLSTGVASYAAAKGLGGVTVGFDSRIGGPRFAELIARLFLGKGLRVYLFSEPCPFPELSYAVVHFKADLGIFISASHNDKRYNGYKLTSSTGAQLTNSEREAIYRDYVSKATFAQVPDLVPLCDRADRLTIVGPADTPRPAGASSFDLHPVYLEHMKRLLVCPQTLAGTASKLRIGYCAFYGAGSKLVPMLLRSAGFHDITQVTWRSMDKPDGFFPCFSHTQQPDPGDPSSAKIAVDAFISEHGQAAFDATDILIGTDPDSDRMGVVVKVPRDQHDIYGGNWTLLKADSVWALLLWYRLRKLATTDEGREMIRRGFIAQSHVTSDLIVELATKYGLATLQTWVGFSLLAEAVALAWAGTDIFDNDAYLENYFGSIYSHIRYEPGIRNINLGCFEESNGFSILGGPPPADRPNALGVGGHVRDKDGTLAALLIAEVAAYAKSKGRTLVDLIDDLSLEEGAGLFVNAYWPDPPVGQYEGVTAISRKLGHIHRAEELRAEVVHRGLVIAGLRVYGTQICPGKGKYAADADHGYAPHRDMGEVIRRSEYLLPDTEDPASVGKFVEAMQKLGFAPPAEVQERFAAARAFFFTKVAVFPEEGLRFHLSPDRRSHVTLRPSGTSRNLKIYVQLRAEVSGRAELLERKRDMLVKAREVAADFANLLGMVWQ